MDYEMIMKSSMRNYIIICFWRVGEGGGGGDTLFRAHSYGILGHCEKKFAMLSENPLYRKLTL